MREFIWMKNMQQWNSFKILSYINSTDKCISEFKIWISEHHDKTSRKNPGWYHSIISVFLHMKSLHSYMTLINSNPWDPKLNGFQNPDHTCSSVNGRASRFGWLQAADRNQWLCSCPVLSVFMSCLNFIVVIAIIMIPGYFPAT